MSFEQLTGETEYSQSARQVLEKLLEGAKYMDQPHRQFMESTILRCLNAAAEINLRYCKMQQGAEG